MEITKNSITLKSSIDSIAIGGFDGMHQAHQKLFSNLGANGAVVVIESGYANLTPKTYRQEYTNLPVYYYLLDSIKSLSGDMFIALLKEEFPNLKKIVVGFDFCFGANRKHCIESLETLFSGEVVVVDEVRLETIPIHSRIIREYLKSGDIEFANRLLGKEYKIYGTQIRGQGLGSKEFVPTINLRVEDFLLPLEGVYATKTMINEIEYPSITFLGHRVTTDGSFAVETHILDNNISNHSNKISIKFFKLIRENQKFSDFVQLKKQIQLDIFSVKSFFSAL